MQRAVSSTSAAPTIEARLCSYPRREELLAELDVAGEAIRLKKGDVLFAAGDRAGALYFVVHGVLRAERPAQPGSPRTIGVFERGDVLGFAYREQIPYAAVAAAPTKVYRYPAAAVSRAIARRPHLAPLLMQRATRPLADMLGLLAVRRSANPMTRVAHYLRTEFDRRGTSNGGKEMLEIAVSPVDFADLLGLPPAVVGRCLPELFETGILRLHTADRIELLDRSRLEEIALAPTT